MGAATVSRLHADLTFMVGLEAAKAELATARAREIFRRNGTASLDQMAPAGSWLRTSEL